MTTHSTVLRLLTCGSVDDGKSTLIGRLLYDCKAILSDALENLEATSLRRGRGPLDLSLLTDGLQAEREQGITIDVAYRAFATPRRSFILADAPGHAQYTRNMVTAASTADLAVLLVDARKGLLPQTRRHLALVHLLGLRHGVVAVNKMDLVDWSQEIFVALRAEVSAFAEGLGFAGLHFIPLSALEGDMVARRGDRLDWYEGPTLLELLESLPGAEDRRDSPVRLAIQGVLRPHQDFRGYTGRLASGRLRPGDAVALLPSRAKARIASLHLGTATLEEAVAGDSLTLRLTEEVDLSRGNWVTGSDAPGLVQEAEADLCWLDEAPLVPGRPLLLRHGAREILARPSGPFHRLDLDSLRHRETDDLHLNDLARVHLRLQNPLPLRPYKEDRTLGAFILADPHSFATVAAGLVR